MDKLWRQVILVFHLLEERSGRGMAENKEDVDQQKLKDLGVHIRIWQKKQPATTPMTENAASSDHKISSEKALHSQQSSSVKESSEEQQQKNRREPIRVQGGTYSGSVRLNVGGGKREIILPVPTEDHKQLTLDVGDFGESRKGKIQCQSQHKTETMHGKKVMESLKYSQKWSSPKLKKKESKKSGKSRTESRDNSTQTNTESRFSEDFSEPEEDLSEEKPKGAGQSSSDGSRFLPGSSSRKSDRARRERKSKKKGKKDKKTRSSKTSKDTKTSRNNKKSKAKKKGEKDKKTRSSKKSKDKKTKDRKKSESKKKDEKKRTSESMSEEDKMSQSAIPGLRESTVSYCRQENQTEEFPKTFRNTPDGPGQHTRMESPGEPSHEQEGLPVCCSPMKLIVLGLVLAVASCAFHYVFEDRTECTGNLCAAS